MASLSVFPLTRAPHCILRVPGDKSISHRAAIFGGLAEGVTRVEGFLPSEDCLATLAAMEALGAGAERRAGVDGRGMDLEIRGCGGELRAAPGEIDCGNSGTTMRLLCGVLAGQGSESVLVGDASLSSRPMGRVMVPLRAMGADIEALGDPERGLAPLRVRGASLRPVRYEMPVASAQVKSSLLLAGLRCEGRTVVVQAAVTRDHTERMMAEFGIEVEVGGKGLEVALVGPQVPRAAAIRVPGDISSAAFWLVAGAACRGARLVLVGVGLNPTRDGVLKVLERMGARLDYEREAWREAGEPAGDIVVEGGGLSGVVMGGSEIPNIIDELPVLAVAGALASGVTEIRDAGELRVKETDRIAAVASNLRLMGVEVEEREDGMRIVGGARLRGARLPSYGDHRIAMAFAVAGLFAEGETVIEGVECIGTSYPGFRDDLERVSGIAGGGGRDEGGQVEVVAIDGTAASGKSSVAREVARRLGYSFINTGAMYRAITWAVLERGIDPRDRAGVRGVLDGIELCCGLRDGSSWVGIDGRELGEELTEERINAWVSEVAQVGAVRDLLVRAQRELVKQGGIVMEGRDIGTVVFPDAAYKFYIDAPAEVRQARREAQGLNDDVRGRDGSDAGREESPLTRADDAVEIDTAELGIGDVVEIILGRVRAGWR
jgi:3-phosphoshikimate 1-carboxyvinyltransferase